MKAPVSSLDYARWAREQVAARGLTRGQAQMLTLLASYADRRGECYPSVDALAERAVLSARHTERLLGELGQLGLIESSRRGRGSARRRLRPDAPLPASPCPRGTQPLFDAMHTPVFDEPTAESNAAVVSDPPSATSEPPSGWRTEGSAVREEETRAARADAPMNDPKKALAPRLDEVLEILEPAIGPIIEPLAVNSALASFPEARGHDHVQAAHIVASYGFDTTGARSPISLLRHVLRNQLQPARPSGAWHGGRRRPASPVSPAMVEQAERQTATMWRLAAAAGFGGQQR